MYEALYASANLIASSSGIHVPDCMGQLQSVVYYLTSVSSILYLTLVLSISSLHLLMDSFLYVSLQDSCPLRLIQSYDLKNVGRINPGITSTTHDSNLIEG